MDVNREGESSEEKTLILRSLYRRHRRGAMVRLGASLIIWFAAFITYLVENLSNTQFGGISAAIVFLILINPPALWVLARISNVRLFALFSLFINELEIIAYTAVIHFTGGIEAAFLAILYSIMIGYIGMVAPRRFPFIIAGCCAATFTLMVVFEYFNILAKYPLILSRGLDIPYPWIDQVLIVGVIIAALFVIAFVSSYSAGLLRERSARLMRANKALNLEIEERRRVEEALRNSEKKYRNILESIEEGYFEVDLRGTLVFFNNSSCRITGYGREELMGMKNRVYTTPETAKKMYAIFSEIYRTGKLTEVRDFEIIRNDGEKRVLEMSASLIRDSADNPVGFRGIVRDVTETKKLQAQLQHAQKLESIGTISSGVAHNFRNILAGISVNNQLIEMRYKDNQHLMEISERINNAVMKGVGLVDGLMKFSRKERKNDFKMLNLAGVIYDTQDLIRKSFDKKIDISIDVPETIPMMGDRSGLSQVIMNLCTNARDAMPDGGELRIKGRQKGEQVEVVISDTGHGMDQETSKKCFDPFFTTKEGHKGTGLGLSTAYGIVKEHGGDIHVYSEINQGTTFKIYLPMEHAGEGDREEIGRDMIRGKGQKILIVDDEMEMLEPVEDILEGLGFRPAFVGSGGEALEKYASWQPDVVLMDRNMPGMDGISCAKKILRQDPDAKIILISGYDEKGPNGIDSPTREFVKGYLTKPIEIGELSHLLARVFSE